MAKQVVSGAMLKCSFGAAPSSLFVPPQNRVTACYMPAANIMDYIPMVNILPFGMCSSPSNPAVISATTAAAGVFTPMPCLPAIPTPWAPGSPTVLIAYMPALNDTSTCVCMWGGVVSITSPGAFTDEIP